MKKGVQSLAAPPLFAYFLGLDDRFNLIRDLTIQ